MGSRPRNSPAGGAYSRRFSHYSGLFFDEFESSSAWIRDEAQVRLPALSGVDQLVIRGHYRPHPATRGVEAGCPALEVFVGPRRVGRVAPLQEGAWDMRVTLPAATSGRAAAAAEPAIGLTLRLEGVAWTNLLAWAGRVSGLSSLQRFRAQNRNRQLRITTIETGSGELIFDFSQRASPFVAAFARQHARLGLNIVGFLTADLGIGESARCMVRAADAAGIATALVPLKLNCKNRLGDRTYAERLQDTNPHDVNVVHVDPPAARDIDHHHGPAFRAGKYNIGYFAWELPDFPDAWTSSFDTFDEIWCPSDFTTAAVALQSPLPVLTMPHAIGFEPPAEPVGALRARLSLPARDFLLLALFDLNSYSARKNPRAAIEAFRLSGLAGRGAALVIKVQNIAGNEADFAALQQSVQDLPGTVLLTETLSRADTYALEAACDCFVSLHRSEGFGLAVAECMYLGKPVIATDWSATAEYVDAANGCPVRAHLVTLEQNHGPYAKGSTWADPDPAHAAEYMQTLFADRSHAAKLGARARQTIEARFSPAALGARYRRRLECIATF